MGDTKKGFLNIFCSFLGQAVTIAMGIIIPRLILVSYGSEVNGLLSSVNQALIYFGLFEAGVGATTLQALYKPVSEKDKDSVDAVLAATHIFYKKTAICYTICVLGLSFVYPLLVKSELSYFFICLIILFSGLGGALNFFYQAKYKLLMQAEGKSYVETNITTIINVLANISKVIIILLGYDALIVQFVFFLINVFQTGIYIIYVRKNYPWVNLHVEPNFKAIEQKGSALIHQISTLIFNYTDTILLTFITQDLKIVSVYTMYNTILSMVNTLVSQIISGFNFKLGQLYNTNKELYFNLHHLKEMLTIILAFTAFTTLYLLFIPFMSLYTRGIKDINYLDNRYALVFVISPLLSYCGSTLGVMISYAGHFRQTQIRPILESIINIGISIIGIKLWGIFGALFGTIVATTFQTVYMLIYSYKHLIDDNIIKSLKKMLLAFIQFFIVVQLIPLSNLLVLDSYIKLLFFGILIGLGTLSYYFIPQLLINISETKFLFDLLKNGLKGVFNKNE